MTKSTHYIVLNITTQAEPKAHYTWCTTNYSTYFRQAKSRGCTALCGNIMHHYNIVDKHELVNA